VGVVRIDCLFPLSAGHSRWLNHQGWRAKLVTCAAPPLGFPRPDSLVRNGGFVGDLPRWGRSTVAEVHPLLNAFEPEPGNCEFALGRSVIACAARFRIAIVRRLPAEYPKVAAKQLAFTAVRPRYRRVGSAIFVPDVEGDWELRSR